MGKKRAQSSLHGCKFPPNIHLSLHASWTFHEPLIPGTLKWKLLSDIKADVEELLSPAAEIQVEEERAPLMITVFSFAILCLLSIGKRDRRAMRWCGCGFWVSNGMWNFLGKRWLSSSGREARIKIMPRRYFMYHFRFVFTLARRFMRRFISAVLQLPQNSGFVSFSDYFPPPLRLISSLRSLINCLCVTFDNNANVCTKSDAVDGVNGSFYERIIIAFTAAVYDGFIGLLMGFEKPKAEFADSIIRDNSKVD